ncbi:MAG TPA: GNAT family N-acetyltransferase [Steroidobacteraceae bacterium]|jgi:predicted GNAT family acetyltransferase
MSDSGRAVIDNALASRYELALDGAIAFIDYRSRGKLRVLTHAEVPAALRGRGIGGVLAAGALDLLRAQGGRVEARCAFVAQFIARNPRYQDLLEQP